MKILVISDTHGNIDNAVSLINKLNPDYTFHLGDMADDCKRLETLFPRKIIACVKGNNDYFDNTYPLERLATIDGKKIFACHGHKYNVKSSLLPLSLKARELDADIVLYGHTHCPFLEQDGSLLIMNPGSHSTYGIIETDGNQIEAKVEKYEK